MPWLFYEGREALARTPGGQVPVHDDVLGCLSHARAGGGLFQTCHFIASAALKAQELVEVMKPNAGRSRPFSALYPQNRHLSARVRVFVDFLVHGVTRRAR